MIDYTAAGDVYQVNLSQRFKVPFKGNGFALFRQLFAQNQAPFFAFIQGGDHQIVSTSPERFLRQSGDRVETRPRGKNPAEDLALRNELTASSKDDAELSMIVDLLRNDIGKVCAAGTVRVAEHKRLEAYQNVYHLVSVVEGRLDPDKDSVELIAATFPGGLKVISGEGLYLGTYPYPRQTPLADYKTLNYLYYQQAGQWAHTMGFHEALVLNPDGTVSETHTASLLLIDGREVIRPKSSAVLPGVMAAAVCRQLAAGHRIVERSVRSDELISAQQVLATNGLMGAVPVLRRPEPLDGLIVLQGMALNIVLQKKCR
ncbi:MAG: chorismate-binding protein [Deltaproteobacteria bacterium]|nr:chorismate-binding protein [Deltaproteobacteria bacterium]